MFGRLIALLACAALCGACSISRSLSASSASLSASSLSISSSASSSASSAGDDAYAGDVRAATYAFVESGSLEAQGLLREVGRVAGDHGVADWQNSALAFRAIGKGLHDGHLAETDARALAIGVGQGRPEASAEVLAGWSEAATP